MEYIVRRNIEEGKTYRLNSSYGYAGILSGMVKVTRVIDGSDPAHKSEVLNWMEIQSQSMNASDSFEDRMAVLEELYEFVAGHWVFYTYNNPSEGEAGELHLPISIFAEHISQA
jgi:hypothetical protein